MTQLPSVNELLMTTINYKPASQTQPPPSQIQLQQPQIQIQMPSQNYHQQQHYNQNQQPQNVGRYGQQKQHVQVQVQPHHYISQNQSTPHSNLTPRSSVSSLPSIISHNLYPAPVIHRSSSISSLPANSDHKRLNNDTTTSYLTPPASITTDYVNYNHRLSVTSVHSPTYSLNSSSTSPVLQNNATSNPNNHDKTTPPPPLLMQNQYLPSINVVQNQYDPTFMVPVNPNYSYVSYLQPHQQQQQQQHHHHHPHHNQMNGLLPHLHPHSQQHLMPSIQLNDSNNTLLNKRKIIKRRTRTGCLTCRKRRIKCDERKPYCTNCEKSKKVCCGYEDLTQLKKNKKRYLK